MLGITGYWKFLFSGIILNITPGSDIFYVLSKSGTGGRKVGVASACGICTGILIHTLLVSMGLSALLASSDIAFFIMKLLGCAYLVVMGIRSVFSGNGAISIDKKGEIDWKKAFRQGVLTNALNPKVALFFLALLPQFVVPDNAFGPIPFLILGLTFFTTSIIWCVFLAYIASFATRFLEKNPRVQSIANKIAGCVYIVLGLNILK